MTDYIERSVFSCAALKMFLNISPDRPPCRQLIVQLLSFLWKIMLFFRTQRLFRFYSSSLLVAYDAKRLRHYLHLNNADKDRATGHVANLFADASNHAPAAATNVFKEASEDGTCNSAMSSVGMADGSHTAERVHYIKRSISLSSECELTGKGVTMNRSESCSSDFRADRLCRTHSYGNNFDDDVAQMKEDYDALLSELSSSSDEKLNWVRVNMIDFTHVFPTEDRNTLDVNYLEGIENLIKLVEMFLVPKDKDA